MEKSDRNQTILDIGITADNESHEDSDGHGTSYICSEFMQ